MNGGNAANAIPSYSNCEIGIDYKFADLFENSIKNYWNKIYIIGIS